MLFPVEFLAGNRAHSNLICGEFFKTTDMQAEFCGTNKVWCHTLGLVTQGGCDHPRLEGSLGGENWRVAEGAVS